jgi:hypothetical protein
MKIIYTNKWENITNQHREIWSKAYPAINISQELAKMEAWIMANPKNKKSNWERFIVNWFTKAQQNAPRVQVQSRPPPTPRNMDEVLKVKEVTEKELLNDFALRYTKDYNGALRWASGQRYWYKESSEINKKGVLYDLWVKNGKLARKYFGDDLVNNVWRELEVKKEEKMSTNEMIKIAKEIERNN